MSVNWLVLGANGQVGRQLRRAMQPLGSGRALTREACDLAQVGRVAEIIREEAPAIVVNAAAYTAVDRAEDEPALARRINADAVAELADACRDAGAVLVHYSTDYVFAGEGSTPYRPEDEAAPGSVYGRTKWQGEQAIRESGVRHLILRTSWVYDARGHNFVNTMLRLARERSQLSVVDDQVGAPTWSATIADVTAMVLHVWQLGGFDEARAGTYHLCARGETSWYGFAQTVFGVAVEAGLLEASQRPEVSPIASADFPQKAPRPANSRMDVSRLEDAFGLTLPDWRGALETCLAG